eukprot:s1_g881.t1
MALAATGLQANAGTTAKNDAGYLNLALPTLGGVQLWTDTEEQMGWRVQCHSLTGHCRLLDENNVRQAWGARSEMRSTLFRKAPPVRSASPTVIFVHGLGGKHSNFDELKPVVEAQGFRAVVFNYASSMGNLEDHGDALTSFISSLEGIKSISFVTHSMGGRVVDQALADSPTNIAGHRVSGIVRLGPPHQGSALAGQAVDILGETTLSWTPALDLRSPSPLLDRSDAPPQLNIIGSLRDGSGINPLLGGDDDGLVALSEAEAGVTGENVVLQVSHFGLTSSPQTHALVQAFLAEHSQTAD